MEADGENIETVDLIIYWWAQCDSKCDSWPSVGTRNLFSFEATWSRCAQLSPWSCGQQFSCYLIGGSLKTDVGQLTWRIRSVAMGSGWMKMTAGHTPRRVRFRMVRIPANIRPKWMNHWRPFFKKIEYANQFIKQLTLNLKLNSMK